MDSRRLSAKKKKNHHRAADDQALCAEKEIPPWKIDVSETLLDVSEEKEIATTPKDDH